MTRRTRSAAAALALAVVALTSACTQSNGDASDEPTTTATPTVTATPTPTPSQPTQAEKDVAAAETVVTKFYDVSNQVAIDPDVPLDLFLTVARDKSYELWARNAQVERVKGWRQIGRTQLVSVQGKPARPVAGRKAVSVVVCYDVSKVNVVDSKGKSLVAPDREPRARASYDVVKFSDGWFVVDDETKGLPC